MTAKLDKQVDSIFQLLTLVFKTTNEQHHKLALELLASLILHVQYSFRHI